MIVWAITASFIVAFVSGMATGLWWCAADEHTPQIRGRRGKPWSPLQIADAAWEQQTRS